MYLRDTYLAVKGDKIQCCSKDIIVDKILRF